MSVSTILTSKRTISAIVCSLSLAAMAATPVAVWDGYFGDDVRAKGAYSLNYGGNQLAGDSSSLTITNTVGVKVDFSSSIDGNSSGFTLMFRYENMTLGATNTLATTYYKGSHDNRLGVYLDAENKPRPIWQNAVNGSTMQTQEAVEATSGVMALTYKYDNGTKLYSISAGGRTTLFACSGLRGNGDKIDGCAIGGMRNSANGLRAANGMKITAIAIFDGELTESEMTDYAFPGAGKVTAAVTEDTAVSALNNTYGACADFFLTVSDGVTVNMDEPFEASYVRFSSEGSIRLKSVVPPESSEIVKLDINGVQGSCVRSWLNPGVIGFNFNSAQGSDYSTSLATGQWFSDSASASSGSFALSYVDGLAAKMTWSASGCYRDGVSSPSFIHGYLDDNSSTKPVINVSGLPYETYDVIIYCSTDSLDFKFSAKKVNGKFYTWDSGNNTTAETADENASWGISRATTPVLGTNALRVNGLTGALAIEGGIYSNNDTLKSRGCIAAIQIMSTGTLSGDSEFVIDATEGLEISDATIKDRIRSSYGNVRIDGDGEKGVLLDFGATTASISSHIVFNGGKHTLKYSGNASTVNLGANSDAPIFEVANGAVVDFYQHDLTGWSGAQIVSTTDIRIDAGTVMNLYPYGTGTTYYRGRYTLEPGATLTSYFSQVVNGGSTLRLHGGAVQGSEQIYVPASEAGSLHAVIDGASSSNGKLHIHNDSTVGFGIFVGENSTLDFDLAITSYDSNAPIGKWGEGVVNFNGDLSGYTGTLTVHEGTVYVTSATTIASIVNEKGATLAYSVAARPTFTSYSGDGDVVVDISSLVDGGTIASGSYVLAPASVPSYRVSVVGLPENSGFSIAETEDGIVLTDDDVFLPVWTGASGVWTSSAFDGRSGDADGLHVAFYQGATPQASVAVAVDGNKSPASMAFAADDTAYTLYGDQITTTDGITVSGVAPVVISNKLVVGGSVVLKAGTELTLATNEVSLASGALSGSGTLILDPGEGNAFTMSTANTSYTGEAVIASGTVKMGDGTSFGPIPGAGTIRVLSNAKLDVNGALAIGAYGKDKNRVVLAKDAALTASRDYYLADRKSAFTSLTVTGDAIVDTTTASIRFAQTYDYGNTTVNVDTNTLLKIGDNDLYLSRVIISGTGTIDIREGSMTVTGNYYGNKDNTFNDGTLIIESAARLILSQATTTDGPKVCDFTVTNLVLNGGVERAMDADNLIVTGYITGNGTTPMLTLAEGAVFKPTGTGYLTITESLTLPTNTVGEEENAEEVPYMVIDLTDALASNTTVIPLFKVGSAENLPDAENIGFVYPGQEVPFQTLPKGWTLSKTSGGRGYKLSKGNFSIHLR